MSVSFDRSVPAKQWLAFIPPSQPLRRSRQVFPIAGVLIASLGVAAFTLGTNADAGPTTEDDAALVGEAPAARPDAATSDRPDTKDAAAVETPALARTVAALPAVPAPATPPARTERARRVLKPLSPAALRRAKKASRALAPSVDAGAVTRSELVFAAALGGEDVAWTDAMAACGALRIDGVGAWHLPSRTELVSLRRAKQLHADAYWSSRAADRARTSGYAFAPRTGHSAAWLAQETASVVCVLNRPR